jgi:hypothetical protein
MLNLELFWVQRAYERIDKWNYKPGLFLIIGNTFYLNLLTL